MTIDVFFSPAVVDEASVEGRSAVVIDVIRATSTLVEALANGLHRRSGEIGIFSG
jgi:2-phosphosulfolactate phosphatase